MSTDWEPLYAEVWPPKKKISREAHLSLSFKYPSHADLIKMKTPFQCLR